MKKTKQLRILCREVLWAWGGADVSGGSLPSMSESISAYVIALQRWLWHHRLEQGTLYIQQLFIFHFPKGFIFISKISFNLLL